MVVKKKLDYGFGGYPSPVVPRGPRSVRKRKSRKKPGEDSQICAFELLAAVAGKILQESESSASSNAEGKGCQDGVRCEQFEGGKALGSKFIDLGSCIESTFTEDSALEQNSKSTLEEISDSKNDDGLNHKSIITNSDISKDINLDLKLEICRSNSINQGLTDRTKGRSDNDILCDGKIISGAHGQVDDEKSAGEFITDDNGCRNDPTNNCVNNSLLINSGSRVQFKAPLYRKPVPSASFAKHRNNVNLGFFRDDDEKSFRCNSTKIRAYKPQNSFGYRRIRKILTSKYWKVGLRLKDSQVSNSYDGMKPFYRSRKNLGPRERWLLETPKRRKLSAHRFAVPFDQNPSSESISNSPEKVVKRLNNGSAAFSYRADQRSPSGKGLQKSRAANVKLSIKSFKVPELYIEVPETATVGALKRTVMEAITTILRDGLRVGVVLQGKKVRDDNRTLQQAGISDTSNLETLGFTLEPSLNQVPPISPNKPSGLGFPDDKRRMPRSPVTPNLDSALLVPGTPKNHPDILLEKPAGEKVELGLSPSIVTEAFTDLSVEDSKALAPIPSTTNAEALSVIPLNQKPKRSELSHRRTRRPFSVGEVEALVEAVETLGTGRWRDVKMRGFDDADYRTYVDLKDKWKTLVHTASISPQQRRGEPVPQNLLDRVLCAHSYWSLHQSKQLEKQNIESPSVLEVERVGA